MEHNDKITASKRKTLPVSLASPPSLSSELTILYGSLDTLNKGLFVRVFNYLWRYLFGYRTNLRRLGPVLYYWCVDGSRVRAGLTTSEFTTLVYLYQVTAQGANCVHSDIIYNGPIMERLTYFSKKDLLNDLKHLGYISRSTHDPSAPYLRRSYSKQPVFIRLTPSGIKLILGVEKDLYHILMRTSLNDLTGANKKA
jgi:hypothetical protein